MSGFRYIIASTITVQTIIQNNNDKMQEKMRLKTKHFQAEQAKGRGKDGQEKDQKKQDRQKKIQEFIEKNEKKVEERKEPAGDGVRGDDPDGDHNRSLLEIESKDTEFNDDESNKDGFIGGKDAWGEEDAEA